MPIIKNAKIGNKKGTQLIFGTGDISIAEGYKSDNKNERVLFLSQHSPKPESEWGKSDMKKGTLSDEMNNPCVEMVFNNPKSVENVIDQLQTILDWFNEKDNENNN